MEIKELLSLTTPDVIEAQMVEIIKRDELDYASTHSIFTRGALAGMEATLRALSSSMTSQKKLKKPSQKRSGA